MLPIQSADETGSGRHFGIVCFANATSVTLQQSLLWYCGKKFSMRLHELPSVIRLQFSKVKRFLAQKSLTQQSGSHNQRRMELRLRARGLRQFESQSHVF